MVARGFTALKFDPFPNPWRAYIDRDAEQAAVERVRAVREAVGPEVEILVEVHRRLAPMHAVRVARQMEPYDPFWYEEPVSARDLEGLAEARSQINIPVVTGEELYTKPEFREVFERRAADILNPDVCYCGGILELREIAAMAEPYHVAVAPHNYNSTTVGLAATVHASAGMPNFLITEYFVNFRGGGARDRAGAAPRGGRLYRAPDQARTGHRPGRGGAGTASLQGVWQAQPAAGRPGGAVMDAGRGCSPRWPIASRTACRSISRARPRCGTCCGAILVQRTTRSSCVRWAWTCAACAAAT